MNYRCYDYVINLVEDSGKKESSMDTNDHVLIIETSQERPKSAPYLRLKNSKRTSKCQSIDELGTLILKKLKKSHNAEKN